MLNSGELRRALPLFWTASHCAHRRAPRHPRWLVHERDDEVVGFAIGQPLKRLLAFQWSDETGIYGSTSTTTAPAGKRALRAAAAPAMSPATSGPLRNCQGAMPSNTNFAKVEVLDSST